MPSMVLNVLAFVLAWASRLCGALITVSFGTRAIQRSRARHCAGSRWGSPRCPN
jgi:hypothetical protein